MSQLIASATDNLQIWEFINQEECKSLSKCSFTGTPTSISWNHTNQVVAVGLSDKKIDLVQATTGQLLSTLPFTTYDDILDQVRAVKFSGNSRYLASAEGKAVQLWDLKKRSLKTKLEGHNAPIVAISFFADGTIAAGDRGGAIRIWDVKSDSSFQEMSVDQVSADRIAAADNYSLTCMELSLSGPSRVAAGYSDGSLSLWDPVTLCQLRKQNVHRLDISSIAFSPKNPRLIATSSFDGRMTLVDTGSKSADASASIDIGGKLTSITFHENAIHCAVGTEDGRVLFYDWRNVRKPIVTIEGQSSHPVLSLSFQVPKLKPDSATTTPVKKSAVSTVESPNTLTRPTALFSPSGAPPKNAFSEPLSAVKAIAEQEHTALSVIQSTIARSPSRGFKEPVTVAELSRKASIIAQSSTDTKDSGRWSARDSGKEFGSVIASGEFDSSSQSLFETKGRVPIKDKDRPPVPVPVWSPPASSVHSTHDPTPMPVPAPALVPALHISSSATATAATAGHTHPAPTHESREEESIRRNPLNRPVTSSELTEALQLVKYDFHRELQTLMREQVRQFSIAQADTSKLFKDLNAQLQELLESNAALRSENDQLRRIY